MTGSLLSKKSSHRARVRWLIYFLLFGTATAVIVMMTGKREAEVTISATFTNLSESLFLSDTSQQAVNLVISASPTRLDQIDPGNLICQLDLTGLNEGSHTIPLSPADIQVPKGVTLSRLRTPSLTFTLGMKPPSIKADVVAVLEGQPAPGFAVAGITLQPDHIIISGPAPKLAKIDTVKTQPIALENASESFKKEVPLNLPESNSVTPSTRIVIAQIDVRERIVTRVLENLPVLAKGLNTGYRISPETIELTLIGPEGSVKTIETDPVFSVTVNLTGLPPGFHFLKATINLPVRVKLIHAKPEQFEVKIDSD